MKIINLFPNNTGTFKYFAKKFCSGFAQNGYEYFEVNHFNDITPDENDIIFVSNFDINLAKEYSKKFPNSNYIFWYFHKNLDVINVKKWVLTGEYFRNPPLNEYHAPYYKIQSNMDNYIPVIFSTHLDPSQISNYSDNFNRKKYCCFIGTNYKQEWLNTISSRYESIINTNVMNIPEEYRVDSYKQSKFCLGFNSKENIKNSVISERTIEGMSYGCLTFCDVPCSEIETNGAAIYVHCLDDLIEHIDFFIKNEDKYVKQVKKSIEWVKNNGTYKQNVLPFIQYFNNIK